MKRGILGTVAGAAAMLFWVGMVQAETMPKLPSAIQQAGKIRIGVKCDSPPFGLTGPDGKPAGIEVEMAKKIGEFAFGSPNGAELSCVTSEARIPSLNGGKIDLILATLGRTPSRQEVIDYSNIYFWGTSNALVPQDGPIRTLADFKGKTAVIVKGASQIPWLEKNVPGIQLLQLNTTADSIQALLQGRAAGFVGDGGLVYTLAANYPKLRIIDEGIDPGVNGIGMRKNEPDLNAFVNAALKRLKAEGFYEKVIPQFVTEAPVVQVMKRGFLEDAPQR